MIGARQEPRTFVHDGGINHVRHPRTSSRVADVYTAIPLGKRKGIVACVADCRRSNLAQSKVGVIRSGNQLVWQGARAAIERSRRNKTSHIRIGFSNDPLISV